MYFIKKIISDWFGHTRRERRATMIILILIVIISLLRYLIPAKEVDVRISVIAPPETVKKQSEKNEKVVGTVVLSRFDPNTAGISDLEALGIPSGVAGRLIRYRSSGGRFNKPEDILKVYGMDSLLAEQLIPYIYIVKEPESDYGKITVKSRPVAEPVEDKIQIDLNGCDSTEIQYAFRLKHSLAVRITRYRELLGGYVDQRQLLEVYGMTDSIQKLIGGSSFIDTSLVRKIRINSAGFRDIERHPYLEKYDAQAIIKYREIEGRIKDTRALVVNGILTEEKAARIEPYLRF